MWAKITDLYKDFTILHDYTICGGQMYLILGIVTQGLVSFAAAWANVMQDGEHCVTSS